MSSSEMNVANTCSGNTVTEQPKSAKKSGYLFHVVINEAVIPQLEKVIEYFKSRDPNYLLVGEHIGKQPHYHLFAQYPKQKHLTVSKRTTFGARVENCFGSAQDNISYIKCEDGKHKEEGVTYKCYLEEGEPRFRGNFHELTAEEVGKMTPAELKQLNPYQFCTAMKVQKELRTLDAIERENEMLEEMRHGIISKPEIIVYNGASGSGKTYNGFKKAIELEQDNNKISNLEISNNFIQVTKPGADTFVIQEFRDTDIDITKFLELTDIYGSWVNCKGHFEFLRPKRIIICSAKPVEEWYTYAAGESATQIRRRISIRYEVNEIDHKPVEKRIM